MFYMDQQINKVDSLSSDVIRMRTTQEKRPVSTINKVTRVRYSHRRDRGELEKYLGGTWCG